MKKFARVTFCGLLLSTSQVALAQATDLDKLDTAAAEQPNNAEVAQTGLEDIVVTATRREERLQQVPVAVTAITAQSLAAADIASIRNLTQVIPGFIGSRNQGVFQPVQLIDSSPITRFP
jgi:iron complex outermembrane receptor protein